MFLSCIFSFNSHVSYIDVFYVISVFPSRYYKFLGRKRPSAGSVRVQFLWSGWIQLNRRLSFSSCKFYQLSSLSAKIITKTSSLAILFWGMSVAVFRKIGLCVPEVSQGLTNQFYSWEIFWLGNTSYRLVWLASTWVVMDSPTSAVYKPME